MLKVGSFLPLKLGGGGATKVLLCLERGSPLISVINDRSLIGKMFLENYRTGKNFYSKPHLQQSITNVQSKKEILVTHAILNRWQHCIVEKRVLLMKQHLLDRCLSIFDKEFCI